MTNKELQEKLEKFPDDIEIWNFLADVDKYTAQWPHMHNTFSAVYTCVEQGKF